ncbi:V-type ATPase, D subunit (plasmid) [Streptomyces sp. BHT-5-2]|uniref:V-type ATP synthase subunit D n=1 Tax=unclassified Streptomyces TaxID=2593676 RepID=UPI001C8D7061|nr:V-type ATP synthase subunit D [Streptomyces sp. BHT-5-2]QZL08901.1 V-type ATPase, D subunit [Streptomyces sp. BHT-5-2]
MTAAAPPPVGRAARLRLRRNLQVATRGAEVLDRQLHLLRAELAQLRRAESAARAEWEEREREARTWLLRGLLLSGENALRTASLVPPADVTVEWEDSLGVRHPGRTTVSPGPTATSDAAPRNTALIHARTSYRAAIEAAARYGAASAAARLVGARLRDTTVRVRALRRLRIPRLQQELVAVELALEQSEHEDAVRRRWAAHRTGPGPGA